LCCITSGISGTKHPKSCSKSAILGSGYSGIFSGTFPSSMSNKEF
jgi:hypothetical protein